MSNRAWYPPQTLGEQGPMGHDWPEGQDWPNRWVKRQCQHALRWTHGDGTSSLDRCMRENRHLTHHVGSNSAWVSGHDDEVIVR